MNISEENRALDDFAITFSTNGRQVGRLVERSGVVTFEGRLDESAELFFRQVMLLKNARILEQEQRIAQMHIYISALEAQLQTLQNTHPAPS